MADEILEEEVIDPNDVVLKGYSGTDNRYENVPKVWLTSADGESKVPFSYGEAVDNVPVELDFSEGDQVVIAPDGTLVRSAIIAQPENLVSENIKIGETIAGIPGAFTGEGEAVSIELDFSQGNQVVLPVSDGKLLSQVTIMKPETLVEGNVAQGIDIAGIIGAFAGGSSVVAKGGTFTGTGAEAKIAHNLGVVPDVAVAILTSSSMGTASGLTRSVTGSVFIALSASMKTKLGITRGQFTVKPYSSTAVYLENNTYSMTATSVYRIMDTLPTAEYVWFGSDYVTTASGKQYTWFVIGGIA